MSYYVATTGFQRLVLLLPFEEGSYLYEWEIVFLPIRDIHE